MTTAGSLTEFPTGLGPGDNTDSDITRGPDGNLWCTADVTPGRIGRITPSGSIEWFSVGLNLGAVPNHITSGPDGNLWFTDDGTHVAIGRITPSGQITEYSAGLADNSQPWQIAAGPDDDVWFSDRGTRSIGRINPTGQITEYSEGLKPGAAPGGLALGPDGNLWFTDGGASPGVGMVTPSGAITEYPDGEPGSVPDEVSASPDGNLWFTDYGLPALWKVTLPQTGHASAGSGCTPSSSAPNGGGSPMGVGGQTGTAQPRPALTRVREAHARWREPGTHKRKGLPVGTAFMFTLSAKATVQFTFRRLVGGRAVDGRCRVGTRSSRHARPCVRSVKVAGFSVGGRAGRNRIRFAGRLRHTGRLPLGNYTVLITARNDAGRSTPRTLSFRILD